MTAMRSPNGFRRSGLRTNAVTWWPCSIAWRTISKPVPPVAPNTASFIIPPVYEERRSTACLAGLPNRSRVDLMASSCRALRWSLHQEYERNHRQRGDSQHPEVVEVADHVRLAKDIAVELPIGLLLRGRRSRGHENLACTMQCGS